MKKFFLSFFLFVIAAQPAAMAGVIDPTPPVIPEPSTVFLFTVGLIGIVVVAIRSRLKRK